MMNVSLKKQSSNPHGPDEGTNAMTEGLEKAAEIRQKLEGGKHRDRTSEDRTPSDEGSSNSSRIGRIAALIGSLSALVIFIALYSSWAFGKGMMRAIGFPISLISFRSGLDLYPELAIQYTVVLMTSAAFGFVPKRNKSRPRVLGAMCIILLLIGATSAFNLNNSLAWLVILIAALVGPAFAVYIIRSIANQQMKLMIGFVLVMNCLLIHSENLYLFGRARGYAVLTRSADDRAGGGGTVTQLDDYPLVHIVSTERLSLLTTPIVIEKNYLYSPQGSDFLRLLVTDNDNYYFIERVGNSSHPIAISKSRITEIQFSKQ